MERCLLQFSYYCVVHTATLFFKFFFIAADKEYLLSFFASEPVFTQKFCYPQWQLYWSKDLSGPCTGEKGMSSLRPFFSRGAARFSKASLGQRTAQGTACWDPQSPVKEGWGTRGLPSSFFWHIPYRTQHRVPLPRYPHHNLSITASALPRLFVKRRPPAL